MSNITDEIKSRLRISDIVGKKVSLKKKGREFLGICPFHNEKSPSFTVNDDKQFYHCFGCHAHGNVFDFVMNAYGYDFKVALEHLAGIAGVTLPQKYNPEFFVKYNNYNLILKQALEIFKTELLKNHSALNYCKSRNIDNKIIEKFQIGFAPQDLRLNEKLQKLGFKIEDIISVGLAWKNDNGKIYDSFQGRLIFPIFDIKNQPIAFGGRLIENNPKLPKYKNSAESELFKKGDNLYNLNQVKSLGSDKIIINEGYMDVIALSKVGIDYAVAPLGTALTTSQLKLIWQFSTDPIFCFDGDQAGVKAMYRTIEEVIFPNITPGFSAKFVILPDEQDPDDLINKGKSEELLNCINNPLSIMDMIWQKFVPKDVQSLNHEQKAVIESNLLREISKITDKIVCSYFYSALKQKIWEELKKVSLKNNKISEVKKFNIDSLHSLNIDTAKQLDRVIGFLIIRLINNEELKNKYFNEIIQLQTEDEKLDELINKLINDEDITDTNFLSSPPYFIRIAKSKDKKHEELDFEMGLNNYLITKIKKEIELYANSSTQDVIEIVTSLKNELIERINKEKVLREEIDTYLSFN